MTSYQSTLQVIRAVTERRVAVGVLPMPQDGDSDPWWVHLLSPDVEVPRVIGRLPFGPRGNARSSSGDALVIGYGAQPASGGDRTLLATENAVDISHGRFAAAFSGFGMTCTFIASYDQSASVHTLIEIDAFVPLADSRLEQVRERLGADVLRLMAVGTYPGPLPEAAATSFGVGVGQQIATPAVAGHGARG
jgi:chorismate mutase / prephenate dehydratase